MIQSDHALLKSFISLSDFLTSLQHGSYKFVKKKNKDFSTQSLLFSRKITMSIYCNHKGKQTE